MIGEQFRNNDRGVSPVIAVALLIGFTIGLVGLVAVGATDIVQDFGQDAGGDVIFEEDVAESNLEVTIVDVDDEVDEIEARWSGDDEAVEDPRAGETLNLDLDGGETVNVVAIDNNADTENFIGSHQMSGE